MITCFFKVGGSLMRVFAAAFALFIWTVMSPFLALPSEASPKSDKHAAVQGVLDLSDWNPAEYGNMPLQGEWGFYWNRLLQPDDPGLREAPSYATVPHVWKTKETPGSDGIASKYGSATYRLTIRLGEYGKDSRLALYIPSVATAYKLWVNGKPATSNGVVASSAGEMVPKNVPKTVSIEAAPEVELVMQVSNFVQRKGGMWQPLQLGEEQRISRMVSRGIVSELFIVGSLTIMGLYHIGLFLMRREDRSPIYFGSLCLAIAIRTLFQGETIAIKLLPAFPWEAAVKLEYIPAALAVHYMLRFVRVLYPADGSRMLDPLFRLVLYGFIAMVLVCPAKVYTVTMLPFQLYSVAIILVILSVYVRAFMRRRDGSLLNFTGMAIFFLTIVNDILFSNQIIQTGNWIPFGQLAFLFTQSINLAVIFSKAFKQTERLTVELSVANKSLEGKVRERTVTLEQAKKELEEANGELSRMEQSRRRLLSDISHELGTPLTTVRGYIKAMLDGVVKLGDRTYLQLIYDKTVFLDRMIGDLFELTKLEARQIRFELRTVEVGMLVSKLYEKFELEMGEKRLRYELVPPEEPLPGRIAVADVDSIRIEQVFGNLLINAQKHTPAGGMIRIETEWRLAGETSRADSHVVIQVRDTGKGIAESELPFLFDRFYRGRQKKDTSGVGLGLAITKEIVSSHNGEIGVESALGEGSLFYFTLPVRFVDESVRQGAKEGA